MTQKRSFLFLQGPHGPFFKELGKSLRSQGHDVRRIHFNLGDLVDWPGKGTHAFLGRPQNWGTWLEAFVQKYPTTDLVLYGDCRPLHKEAIKFLKARGVRIHIFEEGYIRPHWVTYERDGVNGNSQIKQLITEQQTSPPKKKAYFSQRLGHTTRNLILYCVRYYGPQWFGFFTFPFARSHRTMGSFPEAMAWVWRFFHLKGIRQRANDQALDVIQSKKPYFLLPLQLDSDYQIRVHSPFSSMVDAIWKIMESFAHHAAPKDILVLKNHPLDPGIIPYEKHIRRMAQDLGVQDRVVYIDGGPFHDLVIHAKAMVVINSTSGFQAMRHEVPTKVLGDAIYDIPGLASSQSLDEFWKTQDPVDLEYYRIIREILLNTCQINGSFYTKRGRKLLCRRLVHILPADQLHIQRVELKNRTSHQKDRKREWRVGGRRKVVPIGFF